LADRLGIRAHEGTAMLDRIVLSGRPRVVASTIDLDDLTDLVETASAAAGVSADESVPVSDLPSGSTVAARIAAMWSDLLGLSPVDPDADFFELGGHSLIAIRLMTRMHRELGVRLQLSAIFEAPTVNHLAALVLAERPDLDLPATDAVGSGPSAHVAQPSSPARSLVPISTKGDKEPIFVVHGAGGNVLFLSTLARALGGERPIYGFQAHGIDGADMPDSDVETIASRYVAELREARPGPYVLGGYSGGGLVALDMVRQLQLAGEVVRLVLLFDSVPPGRAFPGRVKRKLYIVRNAVRHGPSSVRPYLRYVAKLWFRRFVPAPGGQAARDFYEHEVGVAQEGTGYINLFPYFSATAERYTVTSYDVDVVVFKAQHVWPTQRDDYYWTPHIAGHLEFRLVPGDHDSMFFPENVPYLAQEVREALSPLDG
jgi:acyl carrier protein